VIITDPVDGDGTGPIVSGDDWQKDRDEHTTVYGGTRVRFRLIGGAFKIRVIGTGVNLSVVGRGQVILNGAGTGEDVTFRMRWRLRRNPCWSSRTKPRLRPSSRST